MKYTTEEVTALFLRKPRFHAKHRIFFLPYAGGGASICEPYRKSLNKNIDLVPLQLPGRENRIMEDPLQTMEKICEKVTSQILPFLDMPFSFWGHCSGSLISYEIAKKIKSILSIESDHLFLGASASPNKAKYILPHSYSNLDDLDFLNAIERLMKNSFENDHSDSAMKILLPGLRADFSVYEKYIPSEPQKLKSDIHVIGGECDALVSLDFLDDWSSYTGGNFSKYILKNAKHYFINSRIDEVSKIINSTILNKG